MAGTTRTVRNISAGTVAAIAAWSSYSHMVHLALKFGERPEVASVLPCSVDGMLVVASMVMVDDQRRSHRVRPVARLAFAAGVLASVAANIAAAHPNVGARIVAAWPAVALLLVVEMLARPPVPAKAEVALAPAAAEPPPIPAAQIPPPAEAVAAAAAVSRHIPPAVATQPQPVLTPAVSTGRSSAPVNSPAFSAGAAAPPADLDRQPPPAADPAHPAHTAPAGTEASTSITAEAADGGRGPSPAATSRFLQPARPALSPLTAVPPAPVISPLAVVRPPLAAVSPVVVPAGADDVSPVLAQRRHEPGDVPAAEPTAADRGRRSESPPRTAGQRRPAAATRQLAQQIIAVEPQLSRTEVAARLGLSTRRLREVLAASA